MEYAKHIKPGTAAGVVPKPKTRANGFCGSDGGVCRMQKRLKFSTPTKPHILIGLVIIATLPSIAIAQLVLQPG
ncbi:hypothetical protein, partial [Pyrobaculum sp.]|uniref:hypothetical protein n=1 Tax=Pyrobaculum sp. TaxID=2004705 RepID=UPI003D10E851